MGGKALKNIKTRRYNLDEILVLKNEIEKTWPQIFKNRIEVVKWYNEKETFGDIDILFEIKGNKENTKKMIKENFDYDEMICNGNVITFNINDLQTDVILTPPEEFDFARVFFAYNDLGLIIGRMAKGLGLTYGFDGLCLKIYADNNIKMGKINLTKDPKRAYEILGLDFDRWEQGFNNMEEIFDFASKSPLFVLRVFEDSFQNSPNRRRDNKRQSLSLLKIWLEKNKNKFQYKNKKLSQFEIINFCEKEFPEANVSEKVKKIFDRRCLVKNAHTIFNANDIMELIPSLNGKELGKYIRLFKEKYSNENMSYEDFVIYNGKEKMKELFENFHKNI